MDTYIIFSTYVSIIHIWSLICKTVVFNCIIKMKHWQFLQITYFHSGIPKTLIICIIGLVIHGLGIGCVMVPTFIDALRSAIDAGFPDDLSTYGMLSGLWSSSFALGAFIGPSVAGILYDLVGFQYGSLFVIACHMLLVSCLAGVFKCR